MATIRELNTLRRKYEIEYEDEYIITYYCKEGHAVKVCKVNFSTICYECAVDRMYTNEKLCHMLFELLFNYKSFKTVRPKWLKRTKWKLELDGYNEKLNIAFEYNGEFHYRPWSKKGRDTIENDKCKRQICKSRGLLLIVIPYYVYDLPRYVMSQLISYGIRTGKKYYPARPREIYEYNLIYDRIAPLLFMRSHEKYSYFTERPMKYTGGYTNFRSLTY